MKCCIHGGNVIKLLFLSAKLLKFKIQKCGQILCAHKPYFLMPGHNYSALRILIIIVDSCFIDATTYASSCIYNYRPAKGNFMYSSS